MHFSLFASSAHKDEEWKRNPQRQDRIPDRNLQYHKTKCITTHRNLRAPVPCIATKVQQKFVEPRTRVSFVPTPLSKYRYVSNTWNKSAFSCVQVVIAIQKWLSVWAQCIHSPMREGPRHTDSKSRATTLHKYLPNSPPHCAARDTSWVGATWADPDTAGKACRAPAATTPG